MKICYFANRFPGKNPVTGETICPSVDGGVENVVYNLTAQMAQRGHEVTVFTSSIDDRPGSVEKYDNVTIYRYNRNFTIGQAPISLNILYRPLLLNLHFDVIHSHIGNLPAPLTAFFYSKMKGIPLVTTYHEDWLKGFGSFSRRAGVYIFDTFLADTLLKHSDRILTPSAYYINVSRHLSKMKEDVTAIPNGIILSDFAIQLSREECRDRLGLPQNKKIVLFVGSLTPRKAPDVLIKSMKKILADYPDSHLVLVGSGGFIDQYRQLAADLGITDNVTFAGFVDNEQKLMFYHSADVFVLPSFSEGFGIVLLEAAACGLALVVSSLEVFRSVVTENENGLFTKTGDESDLAEKIVYLLKNEEIRKRMSENARSTAGKFSWDNVAAETEKIYMNLAEEF